MYLPTLFAAVVVVLAYVAIYFPGILLGIRAGHGAPPPDRPFTVSECAEIAERVHALQYGDEKGVFGWERRNPLMWTSGTASYLDSANGSEKHYNEKGAQTNAFLIEHFDFMYQRLLETLRKRWAPLPVDYCKSLPGFHIFRADSELMTWPLASVHVDQQEKSVTWENPVLETVSFTVAIEVPKAGSGLWIWETREKDIWHQLQLLGKERVYLRYEPGTMAIHDGKRFHMIAPIAYAEKGALRITLQGHAVRCRDPSDEERWWVYW